MCVRIPSIKQEVIIILTFLNAGLSITALQSYSRTPTHSQTAFILALRFLHTWHTLHLRDVGSGQFPGGGSEEIKKKKHCHAHPLSMIYNRMGEILACDTIYWLLHIPSQC